MAKWKGGASAVPEKSEMLREGQIRSFKISRIDAAAKAIEVTVAG